MEVLKQDRWGYDVNTTSDGCISAINSYYYQVLSYGRERSVILDAPLCDPQCVLANTLAAYFLLSSDPTRTPSYLAAANAQLEQATSYEKAVFDAISYLVSQDRDDDIAIELHLKLLKDFPKDLVSLKRAQLLSFYMGQPDISLNLVQQVLSENEKENFIYGMLAFALLELGRTTDAETAAKKGIEINNQDLWAQHALCHVLQYECRFKEAVELMKEYSVSWNSCLSFMYTHNWWHVAVCYLEGHSPIAKVLEIYDNHIWKELEKPDAAPAEVYLNAMALLLRVYVRGKIDFFGDRLKIISDCVKEKTIWYIEWHLDVLTLWALASMGDFVNAEDLLSGLRSRISLMSKKKQQLMQNGIMLAEAMYEYGRGNNEQAVKLLGPNFDANNCKMIGASDEQLDVFNEIYFSILLNTGRVEQAIELLEKCVKKREGVPFFWRLLEKGYLMTSTFKATIASQKASTLEVAYFI